jgi:phosphoglycolate phosphatase-like HAD superfamily hydrolase
VTELSPSRLVLWDIDHTLVNVGGISRTLYERAFSAVTGGQLRALADPTGRTERAILAETLALHGLDPTDELDDFYAALTVAANELREEMRASGRALPGSAEAVKALAEVGAIQSVVAGNIRGVAVVKLQAFGLDGQLDMDIGGYGSDGDTRPPLIRAALARAEAKYGRAFAPADVVVIGDTPLDVVGAHQVGVAVVGVASGSSSLVELRAAGADAVVPDLTDTDRLLALVLGT